MAIQYTPSRKHRTHRLFVDPLRQQQRNHVLSSQKYCGCSARSATVRQRAFSKRSSTLAQRAIAMSRKPIEWCRAADVDEDSSRGEWNDLSS
jgi:hypothetical protein